MSIPPTSAARPGDAHLAWTVGLVSAGTLAFEIALMRILLVASWHHFAFVVISVALLGFGASGTALCLGRSWLLDRARVALPLLALATAVAMPLCVRLAQTIPIESQFLPALLWQQIGAWLGYWLLLSIPFLTAGGTIGLGLMLARQRLAQVYAANLIGSALGAVAITPVMALAPAAWLPLVCAGATLPAAIPGRRTLTLPLVAAAAAGLALLGTLAPPDIRVDAFKYASYARDLGESGEAERIAVTHSPRGTAEVWAGDAFHEIPFLSIDATPAPVSPILIDGHMAGTLLRTDDPAPDAAPTRTLMATPYRLLGGRPRVLLLGDVGSINAWLAVLEDASLVQIVQPHARLTSMVRGLPAGAGGNFLEHGAVRVSDASPRHFVDHPPHEYELIQLAEIESAHAGSGNVGGLGESHLLTVEGIRAAIAALEPDGLLSVCRAIQSPPRDNLKIISTFAEALRVRPEIDPGAHLVVVRDYLGVCTMAKPTPWTDGQIAALRELIAQRGLTPVWFPGVRDEELNRPDVLSGPEGEPGDWLHHGASALLAGDAESFMDSWMFDVRPPRDLRPFFQDFFRPESIPVMREAFGDLWLTRAELAYLFVAATCVVIGVVALLVTVAPLLMLPSLRSAHPKAATAAYFGAIGLAYLSLEIVALSRMNHLVGDNVRAASVTIGAFLCFSGIGSLLAQRLITRRARGGATLLVTLAGVAALNLLLLTPLIHVAATLPLWGRMAVGAAAVAPVATLLGFPMPLALARLDAHAPALVPWAWGVNGFASVLAAPLAMLAALTWSYAAAAAGAIALYAVAAALLTRLPSGR